MVVVGNGIVGCEIEIFVCEVLCYFEIDVLVVMVSEVGVSVYSVSDVV